MFGMVGVEPKAPWSLFPVLIAREDRDAGFAVLFQALLEIPPHAAGAGEDEPVRAPVGKCGLRSFVVLREFLWLPQHLIQPVVEVFLRVLATGIAFEALEAESGGFQQHLPALV